MLDKLSAVEQRFDEINTLLCDHAVLCDTQRCTALTKELKLITPVVEKYREYKKHTAEALEAKQLLTDSDSDKELKALAAEELALSQSQADKCLTQLKLLLLPKDENNDKNVIIEIRSGAGGEESALFAGVLFRMYSMYAQNKGFKQEILNENITGLGGYKEISFMVTGTGAYSRFKFESGVHRVQRIPVTESNGKIQTSTVTVAVLPEAQDVDVNIDPADLQIDTYRSSGAGGQHINKTESAIRITHLPTGIVVECQDERSQYKNKDKAMKILRSRVLEKEKQKQADAIAGERKQQVGTGDRSERIRTYNFPQGRISDHRINLTIYKMEAVLNGELDMFTDALITADTAEKLKNSEGLNT